MAPVFIIGLRATSFETMAPNPLLRIRPHAKMTFGETFGAATGVNDLVLTHKSLVADLPNERQVMEALEALPQCLHPRRTCRLTAALDPAAEFTHELDHFA